KGEGELQVLPFCVSECFCFLKMFFAWLLVPSFTQQCFFLPHALGFTKMATVTRTGLYAIYAVFLF
ncbi:hypothetical protein L9F63_007508, partial [Diploptera punctata]